MSLTILAAALPPRADGSGSEALRPPPPARADARAARPDKTRARLPASFEANVGQAGARVKFLSRGPGHTLALTAEGATLALRAGGRRGEGSRGASARARAQGESARRARAPEPSFRLVGMRFVGANTRAQVSGEGLLEGRVNYLVGRDPSKWRAGVPAYDSVRYRELYRGIDLVYRGGGGGLEYDFRLAPGADPGDIRLRFDGADSLSIGEGGELLLRAGTETVSQSAPVVYQQRGGARREVAGRFVVRGKREVGFRLGEYDRGLPLVIDPVLVYSTYFPEASEMAVDPAGGVYVVGTAYRPDFYAPPAPTPGAFQTTLRGDSDAFVAKLDPTGTRLSYLTYLGGGPDATGSGGEYGQDVAVDADGNAYVTGLTYSKDFPVRNAFQPASGGGGSEGFVSKLNPAGTALVYSSYLGGSDTEWSRAVAVDAAGAAYVFGETFSPDFPLKNALQPTLKGFDFFVTKVAPSGSALEYSTYLGGTGMETGYLGDIAVDSSGAAYVAGTSYSFDYPVTPGAFQPATKTPPGNFNSDLVVTKIAPGGGSLVYSTYLGGTDIDFCYGLAVDAAGQAHVVGTTTSQDFPTLNALYTPPPRWQDSGFLAKLNASGTALVYSTYLRGTLPPCSVPTRLDFTPIVCSGEAATAVATDSAGNAYVTGNTVSKDFPAPVNALQDGLNGPSDAFLIKLSPAGAPLYSTYFGGSSGEEGADVYADASGKVYLLGYTSSDDTPLVNPYRDPYARGASFVAEFTDAPPPGQDSGVRFESSSYSVSEQGGAVEVFVTRSGDLSRAVSVDYSTGDRTASERQDYTTARGTLRFAPGESRKSFNVSVTDDNTVEDDEETLSLTLFNLRGPAVLAAPASALLAVRDDDARPAPSNPVDSSAFFVRQHYLDFLNREPDADGLAFWTNEIEKCGADQQCREVRRVSVSAAFFLSIEFQETGFLVARLYRLAFGAQVSYHSFVRDAHAVGEGVVVGPGDWPSRLAANRRAYAEEFVARPAFRAEFPESLT
ncbi:MAG TPA: SBBP repeat-containing protein, partial [Pyrinomonadaceae bacterium]